MRVWDVLQRSKSGDSWDVVGGVKAPDVELALLLARESLFRHRERDTFAVRRRGEEEIHEVPDPTGIGGVISREFRRTDAFAGVGAKHRRIHDEMRKRGLVIDRPRPPDLRQRREHEAADA